MNEGSQCLYISIDTLYVVRRTNTFTVACLNETLTDQLPMFSKACNQSS